MVESPQQIVISIVFTPDALYYSALVCNKVITDYSALDISMPMINLAIYFWAIGIKSKHLEETCADTKWNGNTTKQLL